MLNLNILNFGHHCALFLKETMLQIKASFVATSETDILNFIKFHLLLLNWNSGPFQRAGHLSDCVLVHIWPRGHWCFILGRVPEQFYWGHRLHHIRRVQYCDCDCTYQHVHSCDDQIVSKYCGEGLTRILFIPYHFISLWTGYGYCGAIICSRLNM